MPEPRQAVRLDDKEEDDQGAEHHEFQVRDDLDGDLQPEQGWHVAQQDRQQHDEGGAEEGAEDRAETADDDHEQNLERAVDLEGQRLHRARIDEGPEGAGNADVEGADGKGREDRKSTRLNSSN